MNLTKELPKSAAITLPAEDTLHFRKILHYLYYGTWRCSSWTELHVCEEDYDYCTCTQRGCIIDLYIRASRYQLSELKSDLLENVNLYVEVGQCPGDVELRTFFKQHMSKVWENAMGSHGFYSMSDESVAVCTNDGGEFEMDLAITLVSAF
jgi:hypothetical protein